MRANTLALELLHKINTNWRAANYPSVGLLYPATNGAALPILYLNCSPDGKSPIAPSKIHLQVQQTV
jgi:hypothetical protein